jgi:hypothetical protein
MCEESLDDALLTLVAADPDEYLEPVDREDKYERCDRVSSS